jgi:FkbM family methyltransferase
MFLFHRLVTTRHPRLFCLYVNIRSTLKQHQLRCRFEKSKGVFKLESGEGLKWASVNSRVMSLADGYMSRATYVARTYFLPQIQFQEDDLVVDCGASMGDLEYFIRLTLPKVRYMGYEANPNDFQCLLLNVGSDKCKNIGLWNRSATVPFFVNDTHASSSFIEPPQFTEVIPIPARTLASEFPSDRIRLLKVEAEGAEPEVLQGAYEILSNIDYIVVDVGPERGVDEAETREWVVSYLLANQFELVRENSGHRKIVLFRRIGCE